MAETIVCALIVFGGVACIVWCIALVIIHGDDDTPIESERVMLWRASDWRGRRGR